MFFHTYDFHTYEYAYEYAYDFICSVYSWNYGWQPQWASRGPPQVAAVEDEHMDEDCADRRGGLCQGFTQVCLPRHQPFNDVKMGLK